MRTAISSKAVRETLAALSVIASLVFVGVEIQQNTAATAATAARFHPDSVAAPEAEYDLAP